MTQKRRKNSSTCFHQKVEHILEEIEKRTKEPNGHDVYVFPNILTNHLKFYF